MTSKIIPLPFVLLYVGSVERKGKNYISLNISRTKRAFLMKSKILFIVFEGLSFGGKTKFWEKIADTSFNLIPQRFWPNCRVILSLRFPGSFDITMGINIGP